MLERKQVNILRVLSMPIAVGALWTLTQVILLAPGWALPIPIAIVALPIWYFVEETSHIANRSLLEKVFAPNSKLRKFLWHGRFLSLKNAVISFFLAVTFLSVATLMDQVHWYLLGISTIILGGITPYIATQIGKESNAEYTYAFVRWGPLFWGNVILVTLFMFAANYWYVGGPDTREVPYEIVVEEAFIVGSNKANSQFVGLMSGAVNVADAVAWHIAEEAIPAYFGGLQRFLAWLVFLLLPGVYVFVGTKVCLGVAAVVEKRSLVSSAQSMSFNVTFIALVVAYLWVYTHVDKGAVDRMAEGFKSELKELSACRDRPAKEVTISNRINKDLKIAREKAVVVIKNRIPLAVDSAFILSKKGVDNYLGWHFSIIAEYAQLTKFASGDLPAYMQKKFTRYVYEKSGVSSSLVTGIKSVRDEIDEGLAKTMKQTGIELEQTMKSEPCFSHLTSHLNDLTDSLSSAPPMGGVVVGSTVAVKLAIKKVGIQTAKKILAKKAVAFTAKVAAKVAAKKTAQVATAAAAGAAMCSVLGPAALICGAALAAITWVAVDKAGVEIDKFFNKKNLRKKILAELQHEKKSLKSQLVENELARIDSIINGYAKRLKKFVPADHD